MRRFLALLAVCAFVMTLHVQARAELMLSSTPTYLSFQNWEDYYRQGGAALDATTGRPLTGSIFYGVFSTTDISPGVGMPFVTGVFLLQVAEVQGDRTTFSPVSSSSALTGLGSAFDPLRGLFFDASGANVSNDVLKLFGSTSALGGSGTEGDFLTQASSGQFFMTASLNAGDFWYGVNGNLLNTDSAMKTYYGLSVTDYLNVGDPDLALLAYADVLATPTPNHVPATAHELVGYSSVSMSTYIQSSSGTGSLDRVFQLKSQDPMVVATPEPGTLLLIGSGMLGVFAARRRRARA